MAMPMRALLQLLIVHKIDRCVKLRTTAQTRLRKPQVYMFYN